MAFIAPADRVEEVDFIAPADRVEGVGFIAPADRVEEVGFIAPADRVEEVNDPTLSQIGLGLGTEIGAGIGGQLGGAAIGTIILPGIGTAIGYTVGSLGSGIAGSLAAQKIEGRDEISWGRAIAAGLINLVPGGAAKGVKGAATLGKVAAREAAKGAAFGATEATSRAIIDEGRLPSPKELAQFGGAGAIFGGTLGPVATKIGRKFAGKTAEQIDEAVASGEISYKDLDWVLKQGRAPMAKKDAPAMEGFLRREMAETRENVMAQEAQSALAETNKLRVPSTLKRVWASVAPSRVAKRGAQEVSIDYKNRISEAESQAGRIQRRVNKLLETNPNAQKYVNDFLAGADMDPAIKEIAPQLNQYREMLDELQTELIGQLDAGQMQQLGDADRAALRQTIAQSQKDANYTTREYELFTNKNYLPDPKKRLAAERELRQFYMREQRSFEDASEQAKKHLDHLLQYSARNVADDPKKAVPYKLEGILRRRKDPGPAERAYLGEITDPAERMRGTLTRTARLVARNRADAGIAAQLEATGLASRTAKPGYETLELRSADETGLFVAPEVQIAINKLYADNFMEQSTDIIKEGAQDLLSSGIGLSKAVKVLGNLPSYAVQLWGNAANLSGMAINVFNPATMGRGLRLAFSDFGWIEDLTRNPVARKKVLEDMGTMERYGLKGGNVIDSDLRQTLNRGVFSKNIKKLVEPFGKAYSALDVMGRYLGWKSNQHTMKRIFPALNEEAIKRLSAQVMNDTYQNYDKLSNTVRWATKWGIMPQFASFTAEFLRNQYNQARIIREMLNGTFGRDLGLDLSQANLRAMRSEGLKRATALAAVYGGIYGANEGIKSMFGVDNEKEMALRETVLPEWDRNKSLAMALSEDGKTGSYANMSYIVPHALGVSAIKAGLDGSPVTSLAGLIVDELVGEGTFINKEAMRALDNRNDRGKPISYDEDKFQNFKDRLTYFLVQSFKPGTAREIDKVMKASRGEGDYTMGEIAARQAGYRVNKFDIAEQSVFNIKRTNENFNLAKQEYNVARDYKQISPQELEQIYQESNASMGQSFEKLQRHNENLKTLGKSEAERVEILKRAGLSGKNILGILDGNYTDLPRSRVLSVSDIYDELPADPAARKAKVREIAKTDYDLAKKLVQNIARESKDLGLSEREKLLMNQSPQERANYIMRQPNPRAYAKTLDRSILTKSVVDAIMKMERR